MTNVMAVLAQQDTGASFGLIWHDTGVDSISEVSKVKEPGVIKRVLQNRDEHTVPIIRDLEVGGQNRAIEVLDNMIEDLGRQSWRWLLSRQGGCHCCARG